MKNKRKLKLKKGIINKFLLIIPITTLIISSIEIITWLNDSPKTKKIIENIETVTEVKEYVLAHRL